MADNVTANAGSGGATFAADDISSVYYPRVKLVIGANGTNDGDIASGNPLPVTVSNTVTVGSHAVTNAGTFAVQAVCTNAGTFATQAVCTNAGTFAVQVDGAALTALQVIDDWDESDRCKTNPIVGQAGVAAGSGTVGATTQRVTLASNDPGVALLTTIDDDTSAMTTSLNILDDWDNTASDGASVSGDVAHDGLDAGEPVKIGARAESSISGVTLVADGDRTNLYAGLDGVLIVRTHCNLEDIVTGNASNTDGAATEVIAAAGSGIKQYLTSVSLGNTSATPVYVELKSGSTVRWRFYVPATGGVTHTWDPPLPPNAANEAWNADSSAAATTLYFSANGFKSKI